MVDVGLKESTFHEGECMRRGWYPNRPLDLTLARTKGSLAVAQGPVVAVYGLDLVEASSAIYIIHPVCVAGVDEVVARASVHLVVALAGGDLVVAASALDLVPTTSLEAVVPASAFDLVVASAPVETVVLVGSEERIVA
jgi:hypothetical protein